MPVKDSPFAESICQVAKPHRDVSAENVKKEAWRASSTSAFRQFPGALERDGGPGTDYKRWIRLSSYAQGAEVPTNGLMHIQSSIWQVFFEHLECAREIVFVIKSQSRERL